MKKEIVYTDRYALILSDEEAHIDDKNVYLDLKKGIYRNLLAHLPLSDEPIIEGVPLLPPLEHICKFCGVSTTQPDEECYRASKYKYTEENMVNFAIWYYKTQGLSGSNIKYWGKDLFQVWKSLQQPSRPTHFECEMEYDYRHNDDGERIGLPVHPTNKIKTTTNSQGQIELVGKYLNL